MRRALVVTTVVALAVAAGAAAKPAPPPGPVLVKTSFAPPFAFFGDHVTARVDVVVDRRRVDPRSVVVDARFGRWEQLGATRTEVVETGAKARHTELYTLTCISIGCLPKGPILQPASLPPVTVTARALDGSTVTARAPWTLQIAGRFLPPATGGVRPVLRGQTDVPAATYRVDPSSLALALDLVGGVALALALGVAAFEVGRWWLARRRASETRPPLQRALALVREAQGRGVEDRRRAAALLARLLPDRPVADAAAAVAWSRPDPTPDRLEELAEQAESAAGEESG